MVEALGYEKAQELAERAHIEGKSVRELVIAEGVLTENQFNQFIAPENVTRLGSPCKENKE
jgi:fumarate hydratase class II